MGKTQDNLKTAFAGESQANRKYLAFSKKAADEGKKGIAKLFRAAAEGETIHALNHFRNLGEIKSTAENLKAAVTGETYEVDQMYPGFVADAQAEGEKGAELSLHGALKVEKVHQKMFSEAIEKNETGEDIAEVEYYICPVCGYPEAVKAPEACPVCGTSGDKFYKI
jgi:rubrerythrin